MANRPRTCFGYLREDPLVDGRRACSGQSRAAPWLDRLRAPVFGYLREAPLVDGRGACSGHSRAALWLDRPRQASGGAVAEPAARLFWLPSRGAAGRRERLLSRRGWTGHAPVPGILGRRRGWIGRAPVLVTFQRRRG